MKRLIGVMFFLLVLFFNGQSQEIKVSDFEGLEPALYKSNDTTYVINFWATWCKPCVEEMPGFLEAATAMKSEKVRFIFVSLDFPGQIDARLKPFVKKHDMADMVILLDDPDSNSWIEKVHPQWSGAIPATLIYNSVDRDFYEKPLSYNDLINIIEHKME
ncbi:TlpA disulfide reductase family protein [Marinilabilia rubra]|uniref:Alkyl hydroperoxide reductase n=1 Tax=Marinilabilia rubra TaxID=2162893 RepID=A0A2U2B6E6_9BACT|nr:TlpA disulfide reductase family protein [Marinilabilia rubra]PWD98612.1 alkyl hydroperoxide reductase [Marinilabilia rubra]